MVMQVRGSEEWFFYCGNHGLKDFYSIHFATKELAEHNLAEHNRRAHKK
jgi:hypothetical protein